MISKDDLRILLNTAAEYLKTKGLTDEEILCVIKINSKKQIYDKRNKLGEIGDAAAFALLHKNPNTQALQSPLHWAPIASAPDGLGTGPFV